MPYYLSARFAYSSKKERLIDDDYKFENVINLHHPSQMSNNTEFSFVRSEFQYFSTIIFFKSINNASCSECINLNMQYNLQLSIKPLTAKNYHFEKFLNNISFSYH